jgi:murein DD-endopeptidase MepM/ murein hydrolase activator NlpD
VIKQSKLLVFSLLVIFIGSAVGYGASQDEIQDRINRTKKKLSETKRREKSVLGSLLSTQQELEEISDNLNRISFNLGNTEHRIGIIKIQLSNAQSDLEKIKIEIGGREGVLDQRLIAIYKYGYQSSLEILFDSKNFAEFINRFEMISGFVKGDLRILQTLQLQQDLIAKKRKEIAQKKEELELQKNAFARLQIQNKQQQSRQLTAIQTKKQELSILQNDRKALEGALDELEQTSKELEAQIRNYQNQNQIALGTGNYVRPVQGSITSYFGYRFHPILRKRKYHSGIDISASYGSPVSAADSGVIVFAGRNGGYGKMIIIDHGSGISTVYGHCSLLQVDQGQTVTQGQIIAQVGSTGLSTGPHLHFEVRKNGVPEDPLSYFGK